MAVINIRQFPEVYNDFQPVAHMTEKFLLKLHRPKKGNEASLIQPLQTNLVNSKYFKKCAISIESEFVKMRTCYKLATLWLNTREGTIWHYHIVEI